MVVSIHIWNQKSHRATLNLKKGYFWNTLVYSDGCSCFSHGCCRVGSSTKNIWTLVWFLVLVWRQFLGGLGWLELVQAYCFLHHDRSSPLPPPAPPIAGRGNVSAEPRWSAPWPLPTPPQTSGGPACLRLAFSPPLAVSSTPQTRRFCRQRQLWRPDQTRPPRRKAAQRVMKHRLCRALILKILTAIRRGNR